MTDKVPHSILIAMSSFKGTLSNLEACQAVSEALTELSIPNELLPIGDGGAGTTLPIQKLLGGEYHYISTTDPLGRAITSKALCLPNAQTPHSIYIESSSTCGHALISNQEREIYKLSSAGLGSLIINLSVQFSETLKELNICLGDSAISDAGIGMLSTLGYVFLNSSGLPLDPFASSLCSIASLQEPRQINIPPKINVLCDVRNSLCGESGSARVFSPQKGASPEQVLFLERGMENFARVVESHFHRAISNVPMTGSAGGLAAALSGVLGATLLPGCEFLLELIHFDSILERHSCVITGEGRTDSQTLQRKAPAIVLERAEKLNKKAYLFSGSIEEKLEIKNCRGMYPCGKEPTAFLALKNKVLEVFQSDPVFF